MAGKRLSIVIISWNEADVLRRCLESLYSGFNFDNDEVIVVDNGSSDNTLKMCGESYPNVKLLSLPRNMGVGPARNRGIMYSTGEYIMTLDNDTIIEDAGMLGNCIESAFRENDIGVMGFTLLNCDKSLQQSCRRYPGWLQPLAARISWLTKFKMFKNIIAHHMMEDVNFQKVSYPVEVDYVIGANQIFSRKVFSRLYGYDERIFFGPEDFEFCWRVNKVLGKKNYLFNDVEIVHDYQQRTKKFNLIMLKHVLAYYYVMVKMCLMKWFSSR